MSITFIVLGVMIACSFDVGERSGVSWWKILQNVTFTRMSVETWRAITFMNSGYRPPPGFDGAKIAEGLFEAVPQSFLQTYIALHSLYIGRDVTFTLAV